MMKKLYAQCMKTKDTLIKMETMSNSRKLKV